MHSVKVKRSDLIKTVMENRTTHAAEYKAAVGTYLEKATEELTKMLRDARDGKVKRHLEIPQPETHVEDYDRVIAMLNMSVDDVIELSDQEFRTYVLDEWVWASSFARNTKSYAGTASFDR